MNNECKQRGEDVLWSYHWDLENKPVVLFKNVKLCSQVKYCVDELSNVLSRSDAENDFVPVPRHVLQSAMSVLEFQNTDAA